jgi:uncharacterized membrane protein
MRRLRDLLIDGALLALPIGAAAYLLYNIVVHLKKLLVPVAHLLPEGHFFGIAAVEIAAIAVLLLALAALGLFAHSALGRRLGETLDRVVLSKFPGYQIVKSITADFAGSDGDSGLRPALVSFDDNSVLGFVVEESAAGDSYTVFIPGAPSSGSGSVVLVPLERVQILEAPTASAMKSMKQRGLGLQQLVGPRSSSRT